LKGRELRVKIESSLEDGKSSNWAERNSYAPAAAAAFLKRGSIPSPPASPIRRSCGNKMQLWEKSGEIPEAKTAGR
jgi:hypothetical protein